MAVSTLIRTALEQGWDPNEAGTFIKTKIQLEKWETTEQLISESIPA